MSSKTIEKLQWRYATKKFDASKTLSEEKLNVIKETFNLTATSFGLQPLKLVVISDAGLKEKLLPLTYNQPQVRDASHVLILCIEKKIDEKFIIDHFKHVQRTLNTPHAILEPIARHHIDSCTQEDSHEIRDWIVNQL